MGRCAALLAAHRFASSWSGLPLRVLEIGASAGLNLNWHRYRYALADFAWGDPRSPVAIRAETRGGAPPDGPPYEALAVESCTGCDLSPVDVARDDAALHLASFVWADQPERLGRLRAAIALARRHPPRVERARAGDWLPERLEADGDGVCRVVAHSAVWPYLPESERDHLRAAIEAAGARADARTPLLWARLEHEGEPLTLRVRAWPGDETRRLCDLHPHGRWLAWRGPMGDAAAD